MRFRKSVKIAKGIKINFSKSGVSATFGIPGLSVNVGKKGTYLNTGIPGTGIYDRKRLGGTNARKSSSSTSVPRYITQTVNLKLNDDGSITFFNENGSIITDQTLIRKIKASDSFKAERERMMNKRFEELNSETQSIVTIHKLCEKVEPLSKFENKLKLLKQQYYKKETFKSPEPNVDNIKAMLEVESKTAIKTWKFWNVTKLRSQYVRNNLDERYQIIHSKWEDDKTAFESEQEDIEKKTNEKYKAIYNTTKSRLENVLNGNPNFIEDEINNWLSTLTLPINFDMQFEYNDGILLVDLDLPEIEDLPQEKATRMANGMVKRKNKTQKEIKTDYIQCVFALAMFFSSHIFNVSPCIQNIIISGYTQRRNAKTGDIQDEYIYSIKFLRKAFETVDLRGKEPYDFCMEFENRCNITSTMQMKTIIPFENE